MTNNSEGSLVKTGAIKNTINACIQNTVNFTFFIKILTLNVHKKIVTTQIFDIFIKL